MATESEAIVKEIIPRTHNVKSFRFDVKEGVDFKAGQFMFVTLKEGLSKHFTISNSPTEKGYIEFTKKLTDSDYSKALSELKPGDSVKIKYPYGRFTFEGEPDKIAFLSGGIGITPIRSICKYVIDKNMGTDMILIYGNRTTGDIAFKEDFDIMQKGYPKLRVVHVISGDDPKWKGRKGRIDSKIVKEEIPDYNQRRFYICGPPAMVDAMRKILTDELALSDKSIIIENFTGY